MTDDKKSGIALVAGSFGGMITMAIHPVASSSLTAGQVEHLATVSAVAHSLAMVGVVAIFLGACGLAQRLWDANRLAFAGIVIYGFALVAILIATAISGFIVPNIMRHMLRDVASNSQQWKIVIDGMFQINQAFANIYSVAASIAIVLWSVAGLRNGELGARIAWYGFIVPPLLILGIIVGHLRLNVHGMAIVALGHAIWFVVVGMEMYREDDLEHEAGAQQGSSA